MDEKRRQSDSDRIQLEKLSSVDKRALLARLLADRDGRRPLPLTPTQKRMWLFEQLQPGSSVFHLPVNVRLLGPLDAELLRRAFEIVVLQHDALRFRFELRDGEPIQAICDPGSFPLPVVDLSSLEAGERENALATQITNEGDVPFDLESGQVVRATLFRLAEGEHVLLVTTHHIVSDGWSMGVLLREVADTYGSLVAGSNPSPRSGVPQFGDFVKEQERAALDGGFDAHLAYWKERLGGDVPPLEMPVDFPRPVVPSFEGEVFSLETTPEIGAQLAEASRAEGVTLFVMMLAAFKVLLARYSGEDVLTIGIPVSGRVTPGSESLVGLMMNTVPIRTSVGGDQTFRELLAQVSEAMRGALAHQALPFERILETVQPDAEVSWSPLFQVMFNMLAFRQALPGETGGVSFEVQAVLHPASRFDLTLYVRPMADGALKVETLYRADLFSRESITVLLKRYLALLERLIQNPEVPLRTISVLTEEERATRRVARGLASGPADHVAFPSSDVNGSIGARFDAVASRHPDRVAIRTSNYQWTYSELRQHAGSMAHRLEQSDLQHVERVALIFDSDAPMVAALLGCLLAGRTYVPIDPLLPTARIREIVDDAEVGALLCEEQHLTLAREIGGTGRPILNFADNDLAAGAGRFAVRENADAMAYLLYTSGSTGRPKAVMQSQRNVLHFIRVYTNNLRIAPSDRLTLFSTYSFDAAVMDIFGALLNGATLLPRDVRGDGVNGLQEWLSAERVTVYHSTPTLYRYFLSTVAPPISHCVRLVVLGGEEVLPSDVEACHRVFGPDCTFVNGLGPTESTVTLQNFIGPETELGRSVPVGDPVEGTDIVLLDPQGFATDIRGEIGIRSRHVALGYWHRPDLTASAFSADPIDDGVRLYRTGDLGHRRWDGSFEFLGRNDDQVKVRGFRIELGEVQSVLDRHEAIRGSVAAVYDDGSGDRRLVAYVSFRPGEDRTSSDLRRFMRMHLPEYMVPSLFVVMEQIPLTPTGKVNRKALPAPIARSQASDVRIPPRTQMERLVAGVWTDLLGAKEIGVHDNFFDIGGHSLLLVQAIARLQKETGVRLNPVRFAMSSLEQISAACDEMVARVGAASADEAPAARQEGRI